jgi:hypothetical protein
VSVEVLQLLADITAACVSAPWLWSSASNHVLLAVAVFRDEVPCERHSPVGIASGSTLQYALCSSLCPPERWNSRRESMQQFPLPDFDRRSPSFCTPTGSQRLKRVPRNFCRAKVFKDCRQNLFPTVAQDAVRGTSGDARERRRMSM